jgi:hypothetical protein
MQIHLCVQCPAKRVKVAWISLQPDGSISFGLTDKAFVTPQSLGRFDVFNLYNQVETSFLIKHDPVGLKKINQPHFTFHPRILFHLTGMDGKKRAEIFRAINDVELTLSHYGKLRWLRAISPPLRSLKTYGTRNDSLKTDAVSKTATNEDLSVAIALDFVRSEKEREVASDSIHFFDHGNLTIRCETKFLPPQTPTLAWFHSY